MHIETKFNHGDVVWWAYSNYGPVSKENCSECGGVGSLEVIGKSYRMSCPNRCRFGKVAVYGPVPLAKRMTVGEVRLEIADASHYSGAPHHVEQYMCVETGIGSGSLYYVKDLFATEAEALERAKIKCVEAIEYRRKEDERLQREREQAARELVTTEDDEYDR